MAAGIATLSALTPELHDEIAARTAAPRAGSARDRRASRRSVHGRQRGLDVGILLPRGAGALLRRREDVATSSDSSGSFTRRCDGASISRRRRSRRRSCRRRTRDARRGRDARPPRRRDGDGAHDDGRDRGARSPSRLRRLASEPRPPSRAATRQRTDPPTRSNAPPDDASMSRSAYARRATPATRRFACCSPPGCRRCGRAPAAALMARRRSSRAPATGGSSATDAACARCGPTACRRCGPTAPISRAAGGGGAAERRRQRRIAASSRSTRSDSGRRRRQRRDDRRLPSRRRAPRDRHDRRPADSAAVQAQAVTARSYAYIHLTPIAPVRRDGRRARSGLRRRRGRDRRSDREAVESTRTLVLKYARPRRECAVSLDVRRVDGGRVGDLAVRATSRISSA